MRIIGAVLLDQGEAGMRKSLILLTLLVAFVGCTNQETPTGTADTGGSDTVSSTPTPTPTPALSAEDVTEIENVVRAYFEGFGDLKVRKRASTGDLATWATWLGNIENLGPDTSEPVVISRLEVNEDESTADRALVDFKAKWTEFVGDGRLVHKLAGPVEVLRTADGWKLSDYIRDRRSQKEAVFTKVRGKYQENSGIIVRVLGAVLQNNYASVFVRFENNGDSAYQPFTANLITDTGQQLSQSTFAGPTEVFPGAKVTGQFFWNTALPLKTEQVQLVIDGTETVSFEDRDFSLNLRIR